MERVVVTIEVNKTFMYSGIEYRIIYINDKKERINVELVEFKESNLPRLNQSIIIDNAKFTVTYINAGKNRISLEPVK